MMYNKQTMERRVSVRAIILDNEGKLFAMKHRNHDGGESEYWATPGGGLDVGESLQNGIHRELIEETGIEPVVGKLLFVQQFLFPRHNGEVRESMEFFFHIQNHEAYQGTINLGQTSHGNHEIARYAFIDLEREYLLPEFLKKVDIRDYINNNRPVQTYSELDKLGR